MLFNPEAHEPLGVHVWDPYRAREFIIGVLREADNVYATERAWPLHPEDRYADESAPNRGLYCGAAGTMWALTKLARTYEIELSADYAVEIAACVRAYLDNPYETNGSPVPSYFMGTAGLAAAHYAITGDISALDALAQAMAENAGNPTREIFWGSSGTAIPAILVRERDADSRFDELLRAVQDEFWATWETTGDGAMLWTQDMYSERKSYVGAGHGAFGNLVAFIRAADLLTPERRAVLGGRVRDLLETYLIEDDGAANWYSLARPNVGNRMQWCHGAPGIIVTLAAFPNDDERIERLLRAAGEGVWRAGPVRKGPTLCHGTAGNGYSLLRLAARTEDSTWLHRAQLFAMHAMNQVSQWRATYAMHAFSFWTGELGVASFVDSVLRKDPAIPTFDTL